MYSSLKSTIRKWQKEFSVNGRVTCWTLMERSTWHTLKAEGVLTCPVGVANDDPIFRSAYAWMKESMTIAGVFAPATDLSPWWCWVRRGENHSEPFIEDAEGLLDPVVLQLAIPCEQLVLSCFDLWHFVLNNWYVWSSEMDEQDFDRIKESTQEGSDAAVLLDQRMKQSWSAIFQLDQRAVDMGPFQTKSVQECFWTLRLRDVTSVLERDVLTSYEDL